MPHYLSIGKNTKTDLMAVRVIGIAESIYDYEDKYIDKYNTLNQIEHWEYLYCDNEDLKLFKDASIDKDIFFNSVCLKRYFSVEDQKYYYYNETGFKSPLILHGISHPDFNDYGIIVKQCDTNSGHECYDNEKIEEYIKAQNQMDLNILDHYIEVKNYHQPFKHFIQTVKIGLYLNSYLLNNVHFSVLGVITHKGIIFDSTEELRKYTYNQVAKFTEDKGETGILASFYIRMSNNIMITERRCIKLQETAAKIGGIIQSIIKIAEIINLLINYYSIYLDTFSILNMVYSKNDNEHNGKSKSKKTQIDSGFFNLKKSEDCQKRIKEINYFEKRRNFKTFYFSGNSMFDQNSNKNDDINMNSHNIVKPKKRNSIKVKPSLYTPNIYSMNNKNKDNAISNSLEIILIAQKV